MSLQQIIKQRISEEGSLSIADYMALCLSHPQHGYYIKQDPFGQHGDFITAPEISQVFGELIGMWCVDIWSQLGQGSVAMVELGPGRGTLMADALRATQGVAEFHDHLTVQLIETSPTLQTTQFYTLKDMHDRLEWEETLDNLPEAPCIVIANEFFDALPIRQYVQTKEGMQERRIGMDEQTGELTFVLQPQGLSLAKADTQIEEGTVMESCPAAKEVMDRLCDHFKAFGGALLAIDYGYLGDSHQDTLQAVRQHSYHSVLENPGDVDLTAHVDFSALANKARERGLSVHGPVEQGTFLVRLGAEIRTQQLLQNASKDQAEALVTGVKRLIDPVQMGHLFKVMAVCSHPQMMPSGFYVQHGE